MSGAVDENIFGDALHAILAAEFINPQHPERLVATELILRAYSLDQNNNSHSVAHMLDRFAAHPDKLFQPRSILVESRF